MINDMDISNYIDDTYDSAKLFYETDRMKDFFLNIRSAHKYLCVFGAGCWGKIFCQWCSARKINIDFFCDNNPSIVGSVIYNVPVISFDELLKIKDDVFIIVSVTNKERRYNEEINTQISSFRYKMDNILKVCGYICNDYILTKDECKKAAVNIFRGLSDKRSKELFFELLKYKFIYSGEPVEENRLEPYFTPVQYFNDRYYYNGKNAVILDCGAYNGDSLSDYLRLFGDSFEKYICFEMDENVRSELEEFVNNLPSEVKKKIKIYPYGVYDKNKKFKYNEATAIAATTLSNNGSKTVDLVTLDSIAVDENVTMIKMDIENSEFYALLGAHEIIERNHPILAISIYHSTEQFLKIPNYIIDKYPFYDLYLDLHTTITDDVVLYAIPKKS